MWRISAVSVATFGSLRGALPALLSDVNSELLSLAPERRTAGWAWKMLGKIRLPAGMMCSLTVKIPPALTKGEIKVASQ